MSKKRTSKVIKIILCVLAALVLLVGAYVAYVFIAFNRLPDDLQLTVTDNAKETAQVNTAYKVVSFNTGFGAYEPDYSFFMDGGTQSWAWSKDRLLKNLNNLQAWLREQDADFYFLQEVDENATRTYHVNQRQMVEQAFPDYDIVYGQNWDSPFLFYPFTQPHGKTRCGIMALSRMDIARAFRRSLPIENTVMKLVDLDRFYTVSRVPVADGHDLVLFNMHLSAYTSDGAIATEQLNLLVSDMANEYSLGNYAVCGGDFNKDLLGDSSQYFGIPGDNYTWAQPIPASTFESMPLTLVAASNAPSCRVAEAPYNPQQFVLTIDGFVVSDNVRVVSTQVADTGFAYSDHNPVEMVFELIGE